MNEWTTIVKIAVAAIVLVAAVMILFYFVNVSQTSANESGEQVSARLSGLDANLLDAYNQKTVSGAAVMSAVKNYQGQEFAVLVRTGASDLFRVYNANLIGPNAAEPGRTHRTSFSVSDFLAYGMTLGEYGQLSAIGGNAANHDITGYSTNCTLRADSQNLSTRNAEDPTHAEYINPNKKFASVYLYDENGDVIGLVIEQTGLSEPRL